MDKNISLRELLSKDQENVRLFRNKDIDIKVYSSVTQEITEQFKKYIKENGFPYKDINTDGEYKAGIVLLLHSDVEFMKEVYEQIKDSKPDQIAPKDLAYIIDRIRVYDNQPQIYGTQFKFSESGESELFPVENPDNLNRRRVNVGLEPLEL